MIRASKLPRVVAVLVLVAVTVGLTAGCEQDPKGADALEAATEGSCVRSGFAAQETWEGAMCDDTATTAKFKVLKVIQEDNGAACQQVADADTAMSTTSEDPVTVCLRFQPQVGECLNLSEAGAYYIDCAEGGGSKVTAVNTETTDKDVCEPPGDTARVYASDKEVMCLAINP